VSIIYISRAFLVSMAKLLLQSRMYQLVATAVPVNGHGH